MYDSTSAAEPDATAKSPRSRRPLIIGGLTVLVAGAVTAAFILGRSSTPTAPIASTVQATSAEASPTPTVEATAPDSSECSAFADAYNNQVGPVLKGNGTTGNVYMTEITDAFNALAATVVTATDPYSQTIYKDAAAVAAEPSSLMVIDTFESDLPTFLKQCNMH